MSTLTAPALLAWALLQPIPAHDRAESHRPARLADIAVGVSRETDRAVDGGLWPAKAQRWLAAAAMVTAAEEGWWFRSDVHSGRKLADHGQTICFMGIHLGNPKAYGVSKPNRKAWRILGGLDPASTARCSWGGISSLARARRICLRQHYRTNWLQAMFTLYATGNRCWLWKGAHRRAGRTARLATRPPAYGPREAQLVAGAMIRADAG